MRWMSYLDSLGRMGSFILVHNLVVEIKQDLQQDFDVHDRERAADLEGRKQFF